MTEDSSSHSNEYEREPVPEKARLGFKSFIGQYAGEHTAGTELMIGPLFITHGVSALDLILGLLLGNLLAVLSWTFLTAPIATHSRLTLYYHLERICGRKLVILYNLANGIMFCFLAGAMVTVSATALGVWFGFKMPGLTDLYPNSLSWVLATLGLGAVIAFVAATGYKMISKFANYAAPWMVVVFIAFGLIGLADFMRETDTQIHNFSDFWQLANSSIWTGGDPMPGLTKFTIWHIMFFAWFANMAMHVGMSDLSVFRFAKKSWYGLASSTGMYLGHFLAWIAASILYALQLHRDPSNTDVLPGPLAAGACGVAGLICVVVAGWTTANPTIYRAGLAFQAIFPKTSRFKVTFITGLIAATAGMFPVFAMQLLNFVALYGLILMPMGAVIFCDFWIIPKLGLQSNYAQARGLTFHWGAAFAWFATLGLSVWLVSAGYIGLFFASLPGWFLAAFFYMSISKLLQRKQVAE
jgi:purine-cytosine permease-like protein